MVDILYRGEHRIANIVMTLAAATALWFCFAGNLQNYTIPDSEITCSLKDLEKII